MRVGTGWLPQWLATWGRKAMQAEPELTSADVLERACRSTAAVLEMVRIVDLDRPTPCASWNVRDG
jgi:hypothetical protein